MSTHDYDTSPVLVTAAELQELEVSVDRSRAWFDISGLCPRCKHFVHFVIPEREFSPDSGDGGSAPAAPAHQAAPDGDVEVLDAWVEPLPGTPQKPHVPTKRRNDWTVTLHCNCAETHRDAHSHKPGDGGCGAWFSLTLAHATHGKPRLGSGGSLSLYEERNALERDKLAESELARVRSAAGNWKTGLAALVALIPTLVVVKGTETVDKLVRSDKIVVGVLIAVGAVSAVGATLLALRAANGPLKEWKTNSDDLRSFREQEVDKTISFLRYARGSALLAAAALAAAIAYAWAAPTTTPYVSVDLVGGAGYCGTLTGLDAKDVLIRTADGKTSAVPTADVKSTTPVSSC